MAIYKIILQPTSKFFFGQDTKNELGNSQNYYSSSRIFPQHTTLLGMLRFQILQQEELKLNDISESQKIIDFIGQFSFRPEENNDFGKINRLSPVFLLNNEDQKIYYNRDKEWVLNIEDLKEKENELLLDEAKLILKYKGSNDSYSPKYKFIEKICDYNNDQYHDCKIDKIFTESEQVGILKTNSQNKDAEGYYKRTYLNMCKRWSFCFFAEINEDKKFQLNTTERFVTLGKESSMFKMTIKPGDFTFENNLTLPSSISSSLNKAILISDAYVSEEIYKTCIFANTETIPFKNIVTDVIKIVNYWKKPAFNTGYNLVKKGSVFYVHDEHLDSFKEKFNNADFIKIGYNYLKYSKINSTIL